MDNQVGFSKYGKAFQESLVQLIVEDRPFADQIEEVLDTNFFELINLYESNVPFFTNKATGF